jgi:hypothetical protein
MDFGGAFLEGFADVVTAAFAAGFTAGFGAGAGVNTGAAVGFAAGFGVRGAMECILRWDTQHPANQRRVDR